MNDEKEAFLTYHFSGFKFEFIRDFVLVYDEFFKRKYKISFTRDESIPFSIELLERK
jgi:hypothetical protein